MPEHSDLERDLRQIEATLAQLENEYNRFFAGQLARPPWNTRRRVEALLRRYDSAYVQSHVDRFRLNTLQTRFLTFADLWDRGLRAREEGRPGPFHRPSRDEAPAQERAEAPAPTGDRVVQVTTVADPVHEPEKVEALYESLVEARRAVGQVEPFPFHRFMQVVKGQVERLQHAGSREVTFRVAVRNGKVAFTARGLKEAGEGEPEAGS